MLKLKIQPISIIRIATALLMLIHGIARIAYGIVDDFGGFLNQSGFPVGGLLAWAITLAELAGAILLILNFQTKFVAAYFIFQLLMGIFLVHLQEGWFVVGVGRNGVEYSVLLICCFAAVGWNDIIQSGIYGQKFGSTD